MYFTFYINDPDNDCLKANRLYKVKGGGRTLDVRQPPATGPSGLSVIKADTVLVW